MYNMRKPLIKIFYIFTILFFLSNYTIVNAIVPGGLPDEFTGLGQPPGTGYNEDGGQTYTPPSDLRTEDQGEAWVRNQNVYEEVQKKRCEGDFSNFLGSCKDTCNTDYEIVIEPPIACEHNRKCCVVECAHYGGTCSVECASDQKIVDYRCKSGFKCCTKLFESGDDETSETSGLVFEPEVGIPGFRKQQKIDGDLMGKFAKQLYIYLLGLSGIVAVLVLILAGFQWVMAGGNQNKIGEAKQRIINAITGLVLLSCSYLILYTINPKLVEIKTIEIKKVKPIAVGNFDKQQFFADRRSALDKNISCNDDAECTTHNSEWICAPKNSNSPNVKICMNKSVDNGQCDEDSDCYPGLACTNFQCTIPPELSCAHKNSWTRCFLKLYNPDESDGAPQVVAGYCDGSICRSCLKKNAKCGVSTVGVIPNIFDIIDRFTGESHVYGNAKCEGVKVGNPQVGICGNINKKLTNSKYFQALPEEYKQKSKGSCEYGSINGLTLEYYCVDHK
jgi:hypothetical protein